MIYSNAKVVPLTRNSSDSEFLYEGGVMDRNGCVVIDSLLKRGRKQYQTVSNFQESTQFLSGKWLYGGIIFNHFGHFITETLARLDGFFVDDFDGIVFLNSEGVTSFEGLPAWAKDIFLFLGVGRNKIHICSAATEVQTLDVNPAGFALNSHCDLGLLSFFEECCRRNFLSETLVGNKVYISRSQFPKGMVAGEAALEKELKSNGYRIVHPEKMSFYDQLKVMRGAEVVVGVSGSALHSIIFLDEPPKKIVEIQRRGRSNGTQKIINTAKGVDSQSIYAILESSSKKSSASVKMDVKELSEKLTPFTEGGKVELPAQECIDREYEALISYESIRDVINKTPDYMAREVFDSEDIDAIKNLFAFRDFPALNFYMGRLYTCFEEYEKADENL